MSAYALVTGRIFKDPEEKTPARDGKPFATATVREGSDAATWWSVVAFGDRAADLLRLKGGDVVSVSGSFTVEYYDDKDGEIRLRHKIVADRVAAPRLSATLRALVSSP